MPKTSDQYVTYTPEVVSKLKAAAEGLPRPEGVKAIRKLLNLSERQGRAIYARYIGAAVPPQQQPPSVKTTRKTDVINAEVKTYQVAQLEDVVSLCKVDQRSWKVRSFSVDQRASGQFAWRASFERNKDISQAFIDDLKADMRSIAPVPSKVKHAVVKGGRLLEVAVFDLHLGKLGWKPETGGDFDLKLAKVAFFGAIDELVAKAKLQGPIGRILFPVGNDYLTIDSDSNETTAGTKQDVDSRFAKIYREGRKMLVDAIETLRQIAPVDVMVVAGNHDNQSMFHLGDALECWFHAYDDVKVLNEPISRKYYRFGKVMLCFAHGHLEKHDKLPALAAVEEPALWAATVYREWHLGHFHHESVKEHMGVNVRILSSLSGPDRYHHDNGYVGAKRMAQAFLFNEVTGLEALFQSTPIEN